MLLLPERLYWQRGMSWRKKRRTKHSSHSLSLSRWILSFIQRSLVGLSSSSLSHTWNCELHSTNYFDQLGRKGAVINGIRDKFDVNIQLPQLGDGADEEHDIITITGFEDNANAAREEILSIVNEFVRFLLSSFGVTRILRTKSSFHFPD